jgi:hypothetical protein
VHRVETADTTQRTLPRRNVLLVDGARLLTNAQLKEAGHASALRRGPLSPRRTGRRIMGEQEGPEADQMDGKHERGCATGVDDVAHEQQTHGAENRRTRSEAKETSSFVGTSRWDTAVWYLTMRSSGVSVETDLSQSPFEQRGFDATLEDILRRRADMA